MAPRGIDTPRGIESSGFKKARWERTEEKLSNASNCLYSLAVGLIQHSECLDDFVIPLFGPDALGGLGTLPTVAKIVMRRFQVLEGFSNELVEVLFSFFSNSDCFIMLCGDEVKARKWCDNLCAVFQTLFPNLLKEEALIKTPVIRCAPTPKKDLSPTDLYSGIFTVLFLEVLCSKTLNSGAMNRQNPIDFMNEPSDRFDEICLAPDLLTLSDFVINESRAFEISGSGNLSCNCESFGISDDKEMSSRNLDSIDAENLKQRGENASCSFPKVSLTAMINPVLPLPLQRYDSPMSF